jgi:hypothetical protein
MNKPFLDPNHPMFARAWVRWLTTVLPLAWGAIELWLGNPMWAILFGAAGAYAGYKLLWQGPDQV